VIESASNQVEDVIPGLTLYLRGADPNQQVTITVDNDIESVREAILSFVESYNEVIEHIDDTVRYDAETQTAGPLLGNIQVISIQEQVRRAVIDAVAGLPSTANRLSAIGITSTRTGRLQVDQAKLNRALNGQISGVTLEDVRRLFVLDATSTNPAIEFVAGSSQTVASSTPYQVDLTQAAERASITATYQLGSPWIEPANLSGWTGTSTPESNSGPNYTGPDNDTYTFTVTQGGTIGVDTIQLSYSDGSGNNSGTIVLDLTYNGSYIDVAEGLRVRFSSGTLVQNESFTVQVRPQSTTTTLTSSNNTLVIRVDGRDSDTITLPEGTYTHQQLARMLESQINSEPSLSGRQVSVALSGGKLLITSATYGYQSEVAIVSGTALSVLGFSGSESDRGQDVVGWFIVNGQQESARGHGQLLVGDANNAYTADMQVRVKLTSSQIQAGPEAELTVTRGVASRLEQTLNDILDPVTGRLKRIGDTLDERLEDIQELIERENELMEARQESLARQFTALEQLVGQLQWYNEILTNQLLLATQMRNARR